MSITAEIFVGSDNATGHVDRDALYAALDARYEGWTVTDAVGAWRGAREESVRVVVTDESSDALVGFLADLRDQLHQEAIAYRVISALLFISSDDQSDV